MDYQTLDPGIRDTVRALHEAGFETTDSGDGVSKEPSDEVLSVPHVAVKLSREWFFIEADRLAGVLGPSWRIEASYCPNDGSRLALALKSGDANASPQNDGLLSSGRSGRKERMTDANSSAGAAPPLDTPREPTMDDAAEMLWVVLANVSGGDWTKQSAEWQEAAARWRDNYFAALKAASPPLDTGEAPTEPT